ncbi:MAG: phosphoribosylglycinamide formyltransferase [Verrucomicrobiales bacterium]|jgi:formyltetrahydrofolate-dependent phosphoribosylglycinamide formyltransferase|nr:phosphoribosylglycinamide formyltransferase [Verrucomicrobiales bacterium]
MESILTLEQLPLWRQKQRALGRTVVATNGCFDILHVGHLRYLQEAKKLGDTLIVGVNSDASTRQLKGPTRPVNAEADRAELLAALKPVDTVSVFPEVRATRFLNLVQPDIYVKGGDYAEDQLDQDEVASVKKHGGKIHILKLIPGRSTTNIINQSKRPAMPPLKLGILGSGRGSNFIAISDAIVSGQLNAVINIVISDLADAPILSLARQRGYQTWTCPRGNFKTKLETEIETALAAQLQTADVDLVVLAGYMRVVKQPLLTAFPGRIINIHPSLLPKFPGLKAWEQAWSAGESETGCTVHFVNEVIDGGSIIAQTKTPVSANDTPETLHARIQVEEHKLLPSIIQRIADGDIPLP